MSTHSLIKDSLLAKLPEGALRELVPDGNEDKLWDGIAEAIVPAYEAMLSLGEVREPDTTSNLAALEREYGFLPNENLTEDERRARMKALKYAPRSSGTGEALEDALAIAGFDLVVKEGRRDMSPTAPISLGGGTGEYVVNGVEYLSGVSFITVCSRTAGSPDIPENATYETVCSRIPGTPDIVSSAKYDTVCGDLQIVLVPVTYNPTDNYNLVFYVAADIQVDVDGFITSVTPIDIPWKYRDVIRDIVLRLKPLHTWGYLFINWTGGTPGVDLWGFGFFPMGISPHGL